MRHLMNPDKIIWAVDPFSERVILQRSAAWAILDLLRRNPNVVVKPVYLANDFSAEGVIPQRLVRSFTEKLTAFGNDSLDRITRRIPIGNIEPLEIVARPFESLSDGIEALLRLAHRERAEIIVASTRAGKGGGTFFAFMPGSFVETLTELSDIPVLTINPNWKRTTGIPSIFYPTDFSPESHEWFVGALESWKSNTRNVTVFHKIEVPLGQPFEVAVRIFPQFRDILFRKINAARKEARRWQQTAKGMGFKAKIVLDSNLAIPQRASLLDQTIHSPGLIVVAPPLSATYSQKTIRVILSRASYPVLYVPTLLRRRRRELEAKRRAA